MHNKHVNNLAKYRDIRGWTQKDLADVVGLNQSTIQRAEAEHPSAKLSTYKRCASALDITLDQVFGEMRSELEERVLAILAKQPVERHPEILALLDIARGRASEEA